MSSPSTLLWLVGLLAFFGMARELWAIFIKIWESPFGRLVLLVVYAAIANLTLAVASQKVNIVIGAASPAVTSEMLPEETNTSVPKIYIIDQLIASFVYNYETFEFSHCQKGPNERSVYISENDILVVKRDENTSSGYAFSTRSCDVVNKGGV